MYAIHNAENFLEGNKPVEESGKVCGQELKSTPYLYFSNLNDMGTGRFCVRECPGYGEPIQCAMEHAGRCIGLGGSQYET